MVVATAIRILNELESNACARRWSRSWRWRRRRWSCDNIDIGTIRPNLGCRQTIRAPLQNVLSGLLWHDNGVVQLRAGARPHRLPRRGVLLVGKRQDMLREASLCQRTALWAEPVLITTKMIDPNRRAHGLLATGNPLYRYTLRQLAAARLRHWKERLDRRIPSATRVHNRRLARAAARVVLLVGRTLVAIRTVVARISSAATALLKPRTLR